MAFRFALERLLRFQKNLERQHELLLQVANHEVAMVLQRLEQADIAMRCTRGENERALSIGARASEMHFLAEYQKTLLSRRSQLQDELARRQEQRRECLQAFQEIRRKREATETLRKRRLHAFREQQAREHQRRVDDLFLMRRARQNLPG